MISTHPPSRILLVEDEPLLRRMLCEALEDSGYDVAWAQTADEAWVEVCNGLPFDVLVTDVRMPGTLDGFDLARNVRDVRKGVNIIVMSGYTTPGRLASGVGVFLKKPFTPNVLAETIAAQASG